MKFYGAIGFWDEDIMLRPGVVKPGIVERNYYGDITRNYVKWEGSQTATDDLNINNQFSIISDAYAHEHWPAIKYISWQGVKWSVKTIEIRPPRLIIEVGGIYNGS